MTARLQGEGELRLAERVALRGSRDNTILHDS